MRALDPIRDAVLWLGFHAPARLAFPRLAASGDPLARLAVDDTTREDPGPMYRQLLEAGDLTANKAYAVTGTHHGVREVLRDPALGVMAVDRAMPRPLAGIFRASLDPWATSAIEPPVLLALDPPKHTQLRRLLSRAFTVRRVEGMRGEIDSLTELILDDVEKELAERGTREFDLVGAFASRLPVAIIARLLGVPSADHTQLITWGNEAAKSLDTGLTWREFRSCKVVLREMHQYVHQHLLRLAANPGEDVMSQMLLDLASMAPSERPDPHEVRSLALLVLGAGFETTVNLIGNAVMQLDRHPDQLALLAQRPDLWGNAVEETLRYDPPVMVTGRQTFAPMDYFGHPLPAHYNIVTVIGSANRDPAVFTDPDAFDVARPNADQHLAFSAGAHFCLGAGLARAEAAVALPALYRRFPNLRVTGVPERRTTRILRGYTRIDVHV